MERALPRCSLRFALDAATFAAALGELREELPGYLSRQRWFGSKGRAVAAVSVADAGELPAEVPAALVLLEVAFTEGPPEVYLLPVAARRLPEAAQALDAAAAPLAELAGPNGEWLLYDAVDDPAVCAALLRHVKDSRSLPAGRGTFVFERTPVLSQVTPGPRSVSCAAIRRIRGEQSNSSVVFDDRLILKLFRRPGPGENPDLEVSRFLTFKTRFSHTPMLAGFARYVAADAVRTVAVLQTFVPNAGDGWTWTLGALRNFYAAASAEGVPGTSEQAVAVVVRMARSYLGSARRLGEVTGELHVALASDPGDPAFAPEPVARADLDAWQAAVEARLGQGLSGLRAAGGPLASAHRDAIERVLKASATVHDRVVDAIARLGEARLWKTRTHGDYHLGQVLRGAGNADAFVIVDFEGEPARPLEERRAKQSPLRDVAGMLRSFTYASYAGLFEAAGGEEAPAARALEPWRATWEAVATEAFLAGYRAVTVDRGVLLIPAASDVMALVLSIFCLERAAYELTYELNNRPAWLPIPLATLERELAA